MESPIIYSGTSTEFIRSDLTGINRLFLRVQILASCTLPGHPTHIYVQEMIVCIYQSLNEHGVPAFLITVVHVVLTRHRYVTPKHANFMPCCIELALPCSYKQSIRHAKDVSILLNSIFENGSGDSSLPLSESGPSWVQGWLVCQHNPWSSIVMWS